MATAPITASASGWASNETRQLTGVRLFIVGAVLALANFIVVLDTTVANVSIPHIAGSLGVAPNQGTWVITFYSVADAIAVPLTGWLSRRFGSVQTFTFSLIGFGIFSALCGLANSLGMLAVLRIGQGLCGGPLIPLSQTLLRDVFPKEQQPMAMGLWAMTTLVAPVLGPILGGTISDNWSWPWIFYINIPIVVFCVIGALTLLRRSGKDTGKHSIDKVGLFFMVLWIGCLQLMLDFGRELDWFGSPTIIALAVIAAICFACFLAWELTERNPIVDLKVFRHRGYSVAVGVLAISFGCYFSAVVVIPQWLQTGLGYTASQAGYVTAFQGVLAVMAAPLVAKLGTKMDPRVLVTMGITGLGVSSILRASWSTDGDFMTYALPQIFQGLWLPFFFVPLNNIAIGSVEPDEVASAAGLMSFLRTLAGAVGTSISTTLWANQTQVNRSELVNIIHPDAVLATIQQRGIPAMQGHGLIDQLVEQQGSSLAANYVFMISAFAFFVSATVIWLAPRPRADTDTSAAH